jgi:hypothetical protein
MPYDFDEDLEDDRLENEGYDDEGFGDEDADEDREDDELDDEEDEDDEDDEDEDLDEDDDLDEDFPLGDGTADTSADVWCPYCGESSEISLDPGGGAVQSYVEDCPVCCHPWQVTVRYDEEGAATVSCDADDSMD